MASSPETAAQAALLSAAFSASNSENLAKNIDSQSESTSSDSKESLSPVKSDFNQEIKEEATTTGTEESESEIKMETDEMKEPQEVSKEDQGIDWRPLRSRSFLTDAQVAILSTQFKRNPFPSKYELSALAEQIGVNKRVVQVGGHIKLCTISIFE